ncbi:MAG: hypothetical protein QM293_08850 [Bacteroidota bacterium]|jgi:hypothetical protein|nr:hypothetical protein [Bacteroidota bacterium]HHU96165.1 hypothetical protein [Petrimonas sp.]
MSLQNPDQVIFDTKQFINTAKGSEITQKANGGNSILIVCNPAKELEFIKSIYANMNDENYNIIDLNSLLVQFVEDNRSNLPTLFELRQSSLPHIFKLPDHEVGNDLFRTIIEAIKNSFDDGKIPVLINTGALYGSGIENIHIMEHEVVMKSSLPLIVLYPATYDGENLLFLSKRPASKYRCHIINDY